MSKVLKCKVCGATASVHVGFITDGALVQAHFCHDHAKASGVLQTGAYALIAESELVKKVPAHERDGPMCPECGYNLRLWKQTGRLGCPECYTVFHDEVQQLLPGMHRGTEHQGRIPRRQISPETVGNRIKALQKALDRAIEDERYEDAAVARDEMSELREKLETKA